MRIKEKSLSGRQYMLTVTLFDLWIGEVPVADHHDEAYASHLSVGDTCDPWLACLYSSVGRFGSESHMHSHEGKPERFREAFETRTTAVAVLRVILHNGYLA